MKLGKAFKPGFQQSFSVLLNGNISDLSITTILKLKKINKLIEEHATIIESVRKELCQLYAKKDAEGNPIILNDKYDLDKTSEDIIAKKLEEAEDIEIDIGPKIAFKEIEKLKISVANLIVLDDIISDPV